MGAIKQQGTIAKEELTTFLGPLRVLKKIAEVSNKIELPPSMRKAHKVVHVSILIGYVKYGTEEELDVIVDPDGNVEREVHATIADMGTRLRRHFRLQL